MEKRKKGRVNLIREKEQVKAMQRAAGKGKGKRERVAKGTASRRKKFITVFYLSREK